MEVSHLSQLVVPLFSFVYNVQSSKLFAFKIICIIDMKTDAFSSKEA